MSSLCKSSDCGDDDGDDDLDTTSSQDDSSVAISTQPQQQLHFCQEGSHRVSSSGVLHLLAFFLVRSHFFIFVFAC